MLQNNIYCDNFEKYIKKDIKIILLNEIEQDLTDIFIKSLKERYVDNILEHNLLDEPGYRIGRIYEKYKLNNICTYATYHLRQCCASVKSDELKEKIDYHYEFYIKYIPIFDILTIKRKNINNDQWELDLEFNNFLSVK